MKRVALICLVGSVIVCNAQPATAFTISDCVAHLSSRDIIPSFRLTPAAAAKRCTIIQNRVTKLSARMIGSWTRRDEMGHQLVMVFAPDGTVRQPKSDDLSFGWKKETRSWAVENPYGTVGQEGLEIDNGTFIVVTFSSQTMILTAHPASSDIVERWKRAR